MKRKLAVILLALTIMIGIVACSQKGKTEEIDAELEKTVTALNVPLKQLKNEVTRFLLDIYMPNENKTKEEWMQSLSKYFSEAEYNNMLGDIGDYNGDIKTSIKGLSVRYGLAENNSDNVDKILCSFYLHKTASGVTVRNRIILTFLIQGGEINHHTVYMGNTEKRN